MRVTQELAGERAAVDSRDPEFVELGTLHAPHTATWIRCVIGLLDIASRQLEHSGIAARSAIEQASALLQDQMRPRPRPGARGSGGLLTWQIRKVRDYVDAHIAGRPLVSELSAVVQLSEAHFARSFTRTFGLSPHAFVLRRRVELAAQMMLDGAASLTEIALRCGFFDQAHLCNRFRKLVGEAPGAWRRSRRGEIDLVGRGPGCGASDSLCAGSYKTPGGRSQQAHRFREVNRSLLFVNSRGGAARDHDFHAN
jgi:AraC family transcriptional regulator